MNNLRDSFNEYELQLVEFNSDSDKKKLEEIKKKVNDFDAKCIILLSKLKKKKLKKAS